MPGFKRIIQSLLIMLSLMVPSMASAHVVVRPAEAKTAGFQTFTIGVPNEKDISTTGLKIVIPDGLQYVSPTVKPGWQIAIEKVGEGETAIVKSITWTGGEVPAGQRDDFSFSAQLPGAPTQIKWNAYQTYANGQVVSWDQAPTAEASDEAALVGPYSTTQVVTASAADVDLQRTQQAAADAKTASNRAFYLSLTAIVVGLGVLFLFMQKK